MALFLPNVFGERDFGGNRYFFLKASGFSGGRGGFTRAI
jgi:hypothetical protein